MFPRSFNSRANQLKTPLHPPWASVRIPPVKSPSLSFRNLLALAILLLAGVLIFVVARNFRGDGPAEVVEQLPKNVDLSLRKVHFSETSNGVRKWSMVADSADFSAGVGMTHVENIHMTFFDGLGQETVTLSARSGEVQTESGGVTLLGDVLVQSVRGYTIRTERLDYDKSADLIRTSTPVRITSAWMVLSGGSMRLRVQDQRLFLGGNVQTTIYPDKERALRP